MTHNLECPIGMPCTYTDSEQHSDNSITGQASCRYCFHFCICDSLRACEQRMINASREAILAVVRKYGIAEDAPVVTGFLTAIDALGGSDE